MHLKQDPLTKEVFSEAMLNNFIGINMMSGVGITQQQPIGKLKNI
jgi:hypothetical protein